MDRKFSVQQPTPAFEPTQKSTHATLPALLHRLQNTSGFILSTKLPLTPRLEVPPRGWARGPRGGIRLAVNIIRQLGYATLLLTSVATCPNRAAGGGCGCGSRRRGLSVEELRIRNSNPDWHWGTSITAVCNACFHTPYLPPGPHAPIQESRSVRVRGL